MARRRIRPLTAERAFADDPLSAVWTEPEADAQAEIEHVPAPPAQVAARDAAGGEASRRQRLAEGVRELRVGGGTLKFGERTLMILGGVLAPLGLIVVLLGWIGAANTPNVYEQIPYLISGGLFGLALVFLGAFFYFTHWLTELVKEHRAQSAAVVEAITLLEDAISRRDGIARTNGASPGPGPGQADPEVALVATDTGTMAHKPECVVVAGKSGLREVSAADGLQPCGMCNPY